MNTAIVMNLLKRRGVQRLAWGAVRAGMADVGGVGSKRIKI